MYAYCFLSFAIKAPVPLGRIFARLFTKMINSAIENSLIPIGMMKIECETIYPIVVSTVSKLMYGDRG